MFFTSKLLTHRLPVGFVNKPCFFSHWTLHEIESLAVRPSWTYTEMTPPSSVSMSDDFLDSCSRGIVHELFGPEDQWMFWHPILQLSLSKRFLDFEDDLDGSFPRDLFVVYLCNLKLGWITQTSPPQKKVIFIRLKLNNLKIIFPWKMRENHCSRVSCSNSWGYLNCILQCIETIHHFSLIQDDLGWMSRMLKVFGRGDWPLDFSRYTGYTVLFFIIIQPPSQETKQTFQSGIPLQCLIPPTGCHSNI